MAGSSTDKKFLCWLNKQRKLRFGVIVRNSQQLLKNWFM